MSLYVPECVVCLDVGCGYCQAVPEPWPTELFADLGIRDLQQLASDVTTELARRGIQTTTGPDADQTSHSVGAS